MRLVNLVVAASFLIAAFNAITAMPHIRERHIIRVPLKFKYIHHHKIQKVPIIIKKHVHYHKEKEPEIEHFNHIIQDGGHGDHFELHQEDHQEFKSYDHGDHEDDYEDEQSQEEEYEDDEYE